MLRLALLATFVALLAATAASAATPAQYKSKLNAICRSYTPKLHQIEAETNPTQSLIDLLRVGLKQDKAVEAQPVPASLRATMKPILTRLRKIDVQVNAGLKAAHAGNNKELLRRAGVIGNLSTPLNRWFDAAGLSDCGSKQQ